MATDTTDLDFERDVLERSQEHPVVVDLWAEWCGPCKTLGPILERVVDETGGAIELVKVDVDKNPQTAAAFRVQSIPAVYAVDKGKVVDGFVGALPEDGVRAFLDRLVHAPSEADLLVEAGDESSLRAALELEPDHPGAVVALAQLLIDQSKPEEALALLARIPENAETRHLAALARLNAEEGGAAPILDDGALDARIAPLLERAKADDDARREILDLIEALDVGDPRKERYRRELAAKLF